MCQCLSMSAVNWPNIAIFSFIYSSCHVMPVSQNEIAPRKTAPGVKHVRPPAVFAAIKSAGGDVFFAHLQKISPGAIFFK